MTSSPSKIEHCEYETITMADACKGKFPCLTHSATAASFWAIAEDSGLDIQLSILSEFPFPYPNESILEQHDVVPEHAIQFEVDQSSLEDLLEIEKWRDEWAVVNWLVSYGIAPGQPFRIDAEMIYEKFYVRDYGCYEYDSGLNWEIVEVKLLTLDGLRPEEAWKQWAKDVPEFSQLS